MTWLGLRGSACLAREASIHDIPIARKHTKVTSTLFGSLYLQAQGCLWEHFVFRSKLSWLHLALCRHALNCKRSRRSVEVSLYSCLTGFQIGLFLSTLKPMTRMISFLFLLLLGYKVMATCMWYRTCDICWAIAHNIAFHRVHEIDMKGLWHKLVDRHTIGSISLLSVPWSLSCERIVWSCGVDWFD